MDHFTEKRKRPVCARFRGKVKDPTRRTDVCGTQIRLRIYCPRHPPPCPKSLPDNLIRFILQRTLINPFAKLFDASKFLACVRPPGRGLIGGHLEKRNDELMRYAAFFVADQVIVSRSVSEYHPSIWNSRNRNVSRVEWSVRIRDVRTDFLPQFLR